MKTSILILAALSFAGVGLCGCAYPASSIEQGSEAGHLRFTNAPPGALIAIDGQARGGLSRTEPTVIEVPPGKHTVEEAVYGRVILHRDYEVGAGSTIDIGGGV